MRQKIQTVLRFVLNPRFLLCFGIAWLITNGWSYILLAIGTFFRISWMIALAGTYMALLWFPFTPEKLITLIIAIALLRHWFPHDEKTLGVFRDLLAKTRLQIKQRRANREQRKREKQEKKHGDDDRPS